MFPFNNYSIGESDLFSIERFPQVIHELKILVRRTRNLPAYFKTEIIISFLKDHKINMDWIRANSALVALITSRSLPVSSLELLFESCKRNQSFMKDFEDHISTQVSGVASAESARVLGENL